MTEWIYIKDKVPDFRDRVLFYDPKLNRCFQMVIHQSDEARERWKTLDNFPFSMWKLISKYPNSLMNDCPFPLVSER